MSPDYLTIFAGALLGALVFLLISLPLSLGMLYLFYFFLTLPMRRTERARLFLDLIELGLKDGRTPEQTITGVAASRDRSLGVRFHMLAAHLGEGVQLGEGLEVVPSLLPQQLRGMLQTGERIGSLRKVLPACRQFLKDSTSQVRGALNYLLILSFVVTPATVSIPIVMRLMILPKFKEVFAGMMEDSRLPAFTRLVFEGQDTFVLLIALLILFVWVLMFFYLGGPRVYRWTRVMMPGVADFLLYRVPWRRKRLQRDFSAMFAVLLDAGVPEAEAVTMAAHATANSVLIHRAAKVCAKLNAGVKLPEAIQGLDETPELRWRLANALHRRGGFLSALAGWHEALDAKAFQLEQSAAQTLTAVLVLLNGLVVASIVIAMFLPLVDLINRAALW